MRKIILLFIISISFVQLHAQVKGVVLDSANKTPVDRAVVGLVIKSKAADTSYVISNEKGEFSFDVVPSSNFSVVISNVGYRPVAKFVPVSQPQKIINLGNIILANVSKVLGEVVVESAPITIKEDTIEYRADAFKLKDNAVVEDLLKKLPGVEVDKDGNIKAQGKSVTKVKVNGKDFFGGDPKTATRELPANIIDKVQVIDDYGDQAAVSGIKDGEPEKIINLQIKKDKNVGYFGRFSAGVGDNDRYLASFNGNYFKNTQQISVVSNFNNTNQPLFNFGSGGGMNNMISNAKNTMTNMGGTGSFMNAMSNGDAGFYFGNNGSSDGITATSSFGINYRDQWSKKLSVYGSYSFSHRNNSGYRLTSQQNIFASKTFLNDQNNDFLNSGDNHRFYLNIEYNVDSFNYVKISPSFSYGNNYGTSNTLFDYFTDSIGKTSDGYNNYVTNSTSPTISGNILYNHRFRKKGRNFSANINLGNSENDYNQDTRNQTISYVNPVATINRFLYNLQENSNYNYGVNLTYSEPLSKVRSLDVTLIHNFSYSRNNKKIFDVDPASGAQTLDAILSNDYENNYFTNRLNVSVRTTEKKYNYTLGISAQPIDLRGFSNTKDSAYKPIRRVNIFPVARFSYNFTKTKSLSANYSGNARQPSFSQLQDVPDVSNPQYVTRGNPNLKPSITHNVNLSFNNFNFVSGKVFFSNLSFSTTQNQIVNNVILLDSTGRQLSTPQNVNGYYNANGFYSFSRPYKKRKYVLSLNGNINYNHNINLLNNIKNTGNNWLVGQGVNFEFNQKEWLEFGAGVNYNLNSVKYTSPSGVKSSNLQNQTYSSWSVSSNITVDITKTWVLKYDFGYTINNGLSGNVGKNVALLNASIEKQLFKKNNGIIRLQAFDLLDQNSNINRSVTANSIIDTRTNRLTRYFLLTFNLRLQKFKGKQQQPKMTNLLQMKMGADH